MKIRKFLLLLISIIALICMTACSSKPSIDYGDAESFESALNEGQNLEGKIVQFVADELHPNSAYGYNVWAGEHLNFISSRNPDIKQGDTMTVKATKIESIGGSWFIDYEKVNDAVITDSTVLSSSKSTTTGTQSFHTSSNSTTQKDEDSKSLEVIDSAVYLTSMSMLDKDTAYIGYAVLIHKPNSTLIAQFPKVNVTVKAGDGAIITTDSATGSTIMPGDTITLLGTLSVPIADITESTNAFYQVECSDYTTNGFIHSEASTSDFVVSNVSERTGRINNITGEIKNNFSESLSSVYVTAVFRKDGEIVYAERTFIDNLASGQTKAFEISSYSDWPEHDTVDVTAMAWT